MVRPEIAEREARGSGVQGDSQLHRGQPELELLSLKRNSVRNNEENVNGSGHVWFAIVVEGRLPSRFLLSYKRQQQWGRSPWDLSHSYNGCRTEPGRS